MEPDALDKVTQLLFPESDGRQVYRHNFGPHPASLIRRLERAGATSFEFRFERAAGSAISTTTVTFDAPAECRRILREYGIVDIDGVTGTPSTPPAIPPPRLW